MGLLSEEEVDRGLEAVDGWRREGDEIVKDLKFEDFRGAMGFVNEVADVAEELDHHPDITVHGWNKVRLAVTNHAQGGLTQADFDLAATIDGLPR